jgi:uncharacterized RDD family membrane protein YckC
MDTRILDGEIIGDRLDDVRLYEGVRTKRVFAFLIDYLFVGLLMIPFAVIILILGVLTLGLGWMLFAVLFPLVALTYVATTLGGERQATPGMAMMGIRLERLDGRKIDGLFAIVHSALFWAANALLTPLVLLFTFITDRKRTLHDLLLGTVVVRSDL